jgi:sterol desaturase/sphingolipid hydroxylase (fatty acid hydroxylase superfamily)
VPQSPLRLAAFLVGLLTFLSWEVIAPHHAATVSKPRRWLVNLSLALLNGLLVTFLCAACYGIALRRLAPWRVGLFELIAAPSWLRLPAEIGALDLLTYWLHRSYHRVPLMWRFHRVHHTDLDLDVSSASRFHLGEVLTSGIAKLAFVVLLGISYQGLVAFEIVLVLAAQFQHANLGLHPRLERMLWWTFVPPAMHRVHHSPEPDETDSNFGTLLVAWDRLFSSLRRRTACSPPFGLWNWRDPRRLGLGDVLALPFFRGCAAAAQTRADAGERLEPAPVPEPRPGAERPGVPVPEARRAPTREAD